MRVTVIDYKAGNLTSVLKALRHLGAEVEVTDDDLVDDRTSAERIVLPGVGHFAATAPARRCRPDSRDSPGHRTRRSLSRHLRRHAVALLPDPQKRPINPALRISVKPARVSPSAIMKVPHVGWNSLEVRTGLAAAGGNRDRRICLLHPFVSGLRSRATPQRVAHYIEPFAAAVERGNVMGVQFHPEKSGETGLKDICAIFWSGVEGRPTC